MVFVITILLLDIAMIILMVYITRLHLALRDVLSAMLEVLNR